MSESALIAVALVAVGLIEGSNGIAFALRGKRTLSSAGLAYHEGPGLLIQEFGVYSFAIALAYVVAAFDPFRRPGILVAGISINIAAACMHLARSKGVYFGDAMPALTSRSERNQGLVHAFSLAVLVAVSFVSGNAGA